MIPWEFEAGIRSPPSAAAAQLAVRGFPVLIGEGPHVYITFTRIVLAAMSLASVAAIFLMGCAEAERTRSSAVSSAQVGSSWSISPSGREQ